MILVKPSFEVLTKINPKEVLQQIESDTRTCYKSHDKITSESASNFVRNLIKREHLVPLEFFSVRIKIVCSRGVSHELVRHRLMSILQESQRYVKYDQHVTFVIPPWVDLKPGEYYCDLEKYSDLGITILNWLEGLIFAEYYYRRLLQEWKPEQARGVLPNDTKTELIISVNLRELRHIFKLRCSEKAHPQMQELFKPMLTYFNTLLPEIFEDLYCDLIKI